MPFMVLGWARKESWHLSTESRCWQILVQLAAGVRGQEQDPHLFVPSKGANCARHVNSPVPSAETEMMRAGSLTPR